MGGILLLLFCSVHFLAQQGKRSPSLWFSGSVPGKSVDCVSVCSSSLPEPVAPRTFGSVPDMESKCVRLSLVLWIFARKRVGLYVVSLFPP